MIRKYISAALDYLDILLRIAIVAVLGGLIIGVALFHNALDYPFADFKK